MPVFKCDLSETPAEFDHVWESVVGSGHAPLGLRADWQAQLKRCHVDLGFERVRFHGLLSHPMGTLICQNDEPLYSFFNIDQIFDFLHDIGMVPFVELSFMPQMLASGNKTVFNYRANVTPPSDYAQWATLMRKLAQHWQNRYGRSAMRRWNFEVWNEPNLDSFWAGSQEDYFKLYRHTAEVIKTVDDNLRVGGPSTAQNEWIEEFLDFCEREQVPVDFVSTHHYPTDAFGEPGDSTEDQLAQGRRSVLQDQARTAREQVGECPLYYTEWNSSSNPRDPYHDEAYAAAFVAKTVMEVSEFVDGYSFWTFSDIFEENYFPSQPFHGGFGLLNLYGIPKPTYRAYQILHSLGTERYPVQGYHETVDTWVVGAGDRITVLLTNFALPRHPIRTEQVAVTLQHMPSPRHATYTQIDRSHPNPRRLWVEMGSPDYLNRSAVQVLEAASELQQNSLPVQVQDETVRLEIALPPQSVTAATLYFHGPPTAAAHPTANENEALE